jgi:hypothetical protein
MALSVSKVVRTIAAIALGTSAAAVWHVCGAGEPSPAPAAALTNLPVVAHPPAEQPPTGLPSDTHLDKTPPRRTIGLDLVRNGWTYNCMECHKLFPAKWHYDRPMNEHKDVRLDHGNNRYCLNCHHPTNRNAFVDYDGGEIAQADVVQLCASVTAQSTATGRRGCTAGPTASGTPSWAARPSCAVFSAMTRTARSLKR